MKTSYLSLLTILFVAVSAFGQNWQDCKPDGDYSFTELKASVQRVVTGHLYTGWGEKAFNRSGDLTSVAIIQTLSDTEMASPETLEEVLIMLRSAFACPQRCVKATSDRQPRVALLLLEHLQKTASQEMQSHIDETRKFIWQQTSGAE